jgi:hypothetical protein
MLLTSIVSTIISSCKKEIEKITQQENEPASTSTNRNANPSSRRVYVSNVDELYAAINNADNKGATIVVCARNLSVKRIAS